MIGNKSPESFCVFGKCINQGCFSKQYCLESFLNKSVDCKPIKRKKEDEPKPKKLLKNNECVKVSFQTIDEAAEAFLRMIKSEKVKSEMCYYFCKKHNAYHLTRNKPTKKSDEKFLKRFNNELIFNLSKFIF